MCLRLMSPVGHEDAFPQRKPNGRCRIQKRSVAADVFASSAIARCADPSRPEFVCFDVWRRSAKLDHSDAALDRLAPGDSADPVRHRPMAQGAGREIKKKTAPRERRRQSARNPDPIGIADEHSSGGFMGLISGAARAAGLFYLARAVGGSCHRRRLESST